MAGDTRLTGRPRRRLRQAIIDAPDRPTYCQHPRCKHPGVPIRYDAPPTDPLALDVDEIVARAHGGDPLDPSNVRATHATCNRAEGARMTNARAAATAAPPRNDAHRW